MDCDQIIYLGLFAIIAIYLYQNVLRPEPFSVGMPIPQVRAPPPQQAPPQAPPQAPQQVRASEPLGDNEMDAPVQFNRTPSTCYPEKNLTAEELLPSDESKEISEFNQNYPIGEGILKGINFLIQWLSVLVLILLVKVSRTQIDN